MALDASVFEKLGAFYLGRPFDPVSRKGEDTPLLYDSRDLVTHAVCVGMTGSGKTGLCLALLEEAAIDGVPAIIIDPKGDLGNLLLTFPNLSPEEFRPWINVEDAERKGVDPDAYAEQQADFWKKGLASWGENAERIRTLRQKVDLSIYTPGSTSGLPVNVLASFTAPSLDDEEAFADKIQSTVASLLGFLRLGADATGSKQGIFLSALIDTEWRSGRDVSLARIIELIQHPPMAKIGVLDLESFYPAKERFALVLAINNLLASPNFAVWQKGDPLDAGKFLATSEGKPRHSIFSIAHLNDDERMFFVSLLLNEILSWTRAQSGTTSLRAIIYMDEIFGYLPPTANPPSKKPLLTLLKQARASGVGLVLATQNPVDLDYKALSNAGTWFIGRLQTERDKARVLDGLEGAAGGGKFDRAAMERTLASLGQRVFLMNNVHEDAPVVFETRWTMSYLRGPLTKDQIKLLMADRKNAQPQVAATPVETAAARPALPPTVPQVFLPGSATTFLPCLIGVAVVKFSDSKMGVQENSEVIYKAPIPAAFATGADWTIIPDLSAQQLATQQTGEASFGELPPEAATPKNYAIWSKGYADFLSANHSLRVFRCAELNLASKSGEGEGPFKLRVALAYRETRDEKADILRQKYAPKVAALQTRLARAEASVSKEKEQASSARWQTVISVGSALATAFLGRKALSASTLGRAATAARGVSRSVKEGSDVGVAEQSAESIRQQIADLQADLEAETAAITATEPSVEGVEVRPSRGGVAVKLLALGWEPVG